MYKKPLWTINILVIASIVYLSVSANNTEIEAIEALNTYTINSKSEKKAAKAIPHKASIQQYAILWKGYEKPVNAVFTPDVKQDSRPAKVSGRKVRLTLTGTIINKEQKAAFIKTGKDSEHCYVIDEEIHGWKITNIKSDKVILSNSGKFHTLTSQSAVDVEVKKTKDSKNSKSMVLTISELPDSTSSGSTDNTDIIKTIAKPLPTVKFIPTIPESISMLKKTPSKSKSTITAD